MDTQKTYVVVHFDPPRNQINFWWADYMTEIARFSTREEAERFKNSLPEPASGWYQVY